MIHKPYNQYWIHVDEKVPNEMYNEFVSYYENVSNVEVINSSLRVVLTRLDNPREN